MKFKAIAISFLLCALSNGQELPTYSVVHVAGIRDNGAGGPALKASLVRPQRLTGDSDGNVYVGFTNEVYRIDAVTGVYSRVAGNGSPTPSGDGGQATQAGFASINGVAVRNGFLYIAQINPCNIRRVDLSSGVVTTVAGIGACPNALAADPFAGPIATTAVNAVDMDFDSRGGLLFTGRGRAGRIDFDSGEITLVAGNGMAASSGDGGPATAASLNFPIGITADASGNIYVAEFIGSVIRKIDAATGMISTIAGTGTAGYSGDGGPAAAAMIDMPGGLGLDSTGTKLYFGRGIYIRVVDLANGTIARFAGSNTNPYSTADLPRLEARFVGLGFSFWANADDEIIYSDNAAHFIGKIRTDGIATRIAGNGAFGVDGPAMSATLTPRDVHVTPDGRLLIGDGVINRKIRELKDGVVTTIAGLGFPPPLGDGGPAIDASFIPSRLASDAQGIIYLTDTSQLRPRRITPDGTINSLGTNLNGATTGIAVNRSGQRLYVTQNVSHRVMVENFVDFAATVAGAGASAADPGMAGFGGDGGPGTAALLSSPQGLAVDGDGNLYIADLSNARVRMVSADTGTITTVAGNGMNAFTTATVGPASEVAVGFPLDCAVDSDGNVFFLGGTATGVGGVWRLDRASGRVHLIAGGPDAAVPITRPWAVDVDSRGVVYVADEGNGRILGLVPSTLEGPYVTGVIAPGAFGAGDQLAPGGWFELYGLNLAASTLGWGDSFSGNMAPTVLGGVSVMVNGTPAALSLVSPGQINGQAGDGVIPGNATIQVVNGPGQSNTIALQSADRAGSLLAPPSFAANGKQYVVAILPDGAFVGPPDLIPGASFRRAVAGDVAVLYGVGFGAVSPGVAAGTIAAGSTALPNVTVTIGGVEAAVLYAGLTPGSVGLFQFNVQIPPGVSGDVLVVITVDGVATTQSLFIATAA